MTSKLIAPENAQVCSVSGFLPCYLLWLTQGLPCQISLRPVQSVAHAGRKAEKSTVSKNNTALHFAQCWQ